MITNLPANTAEQITDRGVLRPCQCEHGGSCHRGMHKAGEACDRTVFLTKASRHRICKGCRSEKRKKGYSGKVTNQSARVDKTEMMPLEVPGDMFGNEGPDSLLLISPRTPHGTNMIGSFQPLLSADSIYTGGSSSEGFPVGADVKTEGDVDGVDVVGYQPPAVFGSAPVNYKSIYSPQDPEKPNTRKQPPRASSSTSKEDEFFYQQPSGSMSKRFKAEHSQVKPSLTTITTRNGDEVQLLPCVCTKGGFCHRPMHAIGQPCGSICRISKNVRHRVCKACRSGGKKATGTKIRGGHSTSAIAREDEEESKGALSLHAASQVVAMFASAADDVTPRTQMRHDNSTADALRGDEESEVESLAKLQNAPLPLLKPDGGVLMRRQPEYAAEDNRDFTEPAERDLLSGVEGDPMDSTTTVGRPGLRRSTSSSSTATVESAASSVSANRPRSDSQLNDALLLLGGATPRN